MDNERELVMESLITIVVPLFNEELVIEQMYQRVTEVMAGIGLGYEVILINDGSRDKTLQIARRLCTQDPHVKLISFSRNFGHQAALTAGLDMARGDAVVIIDADLQDPPEIIPQMVEKWKDGFDVVYGTRVKREGETWVKKWTAAGFYWLLRKLTAVDIPPDTGDFRLLDRAVVNALNRMREKNRFLRGMVSWVGFRQCRLEYVRRERFAGETKYPLKKMVRFALDGILSFSQIPLKVSSVFGFLCSLLSFCLIIYGLVEKFFYAQSVIRGWLSTFVAILFLGGVQLICIGILGEYLGRIYDEIKNRPLYVCDELINID
jgi:dolichol-phosphate mannosyltransferase